MTIRSAIAERPTIDHAVPDHAGGVRLLSLLKACGYRFVTPTPATHRRVLRQPDREMARDMRDVLGWNLPFAPDVLPPALFAALNAAGALREGEAGFRARFRVSSLGEDLFLHDSFPPDAQDAVFFGPDTYRFARLLRQTLVDGPQGGRLIDVGVGSGAGAVVAAKAVGAQSVTVTDVNARALDLARINLEAAGVEGDFRCGPGLDTADEPADLIIANPPFIAGDRGRTYRDGGDMHGARVSLDWALAATAQLRPGGRFVLYTGAAIVRGEDALATALAQALDPGLFRISYEELDPDIFGGQLSSKAYEGVERVAAVGVLILRRP